MTALPNNAIAYLRTKVLTAPPEELRLMLLDGAIKFCRQGRDALISKDWENVYNGFSKTRNILMELITSMRPEVDPELCQRLTALYTYLYTQVVDASHQKDPAKADKVIELLEYERETWNMLIAKLREERGETVAPAPQPALDAEAPKPYTSVCVQG